MRRPTVIVTAVAAVGLLTGCLVDRADPARDSATVSETLPEDAGELDDPAEVTSPGGGSGETEEP